MTPTEIKKHLHDSIEKITDEAALQHISLYVDTFFKNNEFAWDSLPESVKESIEESIKQADNGQTIPYTQVKEKFGKWLS